MPLQSESCTSYRHTIEGNVTSCYSCCSWQCPCAHVVSLGGLLFPVHTLDLAFNYRDLAHCHPVTAYIWARHHWYSIELTGFLSLSSLFSNHSPEPGATKLASLDLVFGISKKLLWNSNASQPMGSTVLHWNQNIYLTMTMSTLRIV